MPDARRTQAERRAETERRVLEATLRLIAEGGLMAATLARVGVEAGYSRGIVTHQFGTRDELVRRVAMHVQQRFSPPVSDAVGLERVLVVIDAYLAQLAAGDIGGHALLRLWSEAVAGEPTLRAVFVERDAYFRAEVAQHVARGVAEGSIRPDVDPDAAGLAIVGLLRGIGMQLMLDVDSGGSSDLRRQVQDLVRRGLGVGWPRSTDCEAGRVGLSVMG